MSSTPTRAQRRRDARREARRDQAARRARRPRFSQLQIGAVALAAVALVAVLIWAGNANAPGPSTTVPPNVVQSGHVRGEANAPVTIEEWADFQCPACALFARGTESQLVQTYVARGEVRIVYRHFAFLGAESSWAAEASECAAEQGKFWEYHDKLFASQRGENRGAFSKDNLKRFGAELGLGPAFASCVDSGKYAQAVRDERQVGEGKGINSTPTLFVSGRKVTGAASFEQLRAIIDPLLAGR